MQTEAPPEVSTDSKPGPIGQAIQDVDAVLQDTVGVRGSVISTAVAGAAVGLAVGDIPGALAGLIVGGLIGAVGLRDRADTN